MSECIISETGIYTNCGRGSGLGKSEQQTQKFAKQFEVNLSRAQAKARQFSERTTQYLNNIEKAANNINSTTNWSFRLDNLGRLQDFAKQTVVMMDRYTELQNRIRLVTDGQAEMAAATGTVFDISLRTNQAVSATAEVYQRFAKNADTLKISQAEVAELTETVSKAVAMSGASSASAEAALMQFGQAMASGELRGAELNSVMEQTPGLAQAIADGLGVSVGALKEMGKNGELSISKVIKALKNAKSQVDGDFEKRVKTLSMSFTNLETSMIKFVGETDSAIGVTQKLAEGVEFVATNLEDLITVAGTFAAALAIGQIGKYSTALLQTGINSAKNTLAHTKEAQSILAKATAMRTAAQVEMASLAAQLQLAQSEQTRYTLREQMKVQAAQIIALTEAEATAKRNLATANTLAGKASQGLQSVMALLGGPVGAAMIAGSALWYFTQQAESARQKALDTAGANHRLKESYEGLSAAALSLKITQQIQDLANYDKQIQRLQTDIVALKDSWNYVGLPVPESAKKEISELNDKISILKENANIDFSVLENQLEALAKAMLTSGKNIDDVRQKFKTLGVDAGNTEWILARIPSALNEIDKAGNQAENATLDLDDAFKKLQEKSVSLAQKLEVAKLEQQGQAKSAYVLAGLYELLGTEGAKYNEVLIGIATGTITAANAADKAVGISVETLNKILQGKQVLEGMFNDETQTKTIQTNLKTNHKGGGENARDNWLSFYDDLRKKSSSTLTEIDLEEQQMFQRLEEHMKKGVVSHTEYETAKLAITERFAKERLELAGKYAPEKLLLSNLKNELSAIEELRKAGQLTNGEAQTAEYQLKFDYAQSKAQSAVNPLDQMRAIYDPNQDIVNRQAQELARLDAFHQTQLLKEEEFQKLKQQIIERYANDKFQTEMQKYADGLNTLGSAFGDLTSMIEQAGGKQSAAYKAMFAMQKSFAIAEATINVTRAASQAMADWSKMDAASKFAAVAGVMSQGMALVGQIRSVGFSSGGYTGDGGKYTPAGIVHRGEYVITKEATSRLGLDYLNYLNYGKRGFATGGGVGVPRVPSTPTHFGGSQNVTVTVINNGKPTSAEVETKKDGQDLAITVKLMEQIADGVYRRNQTRDLRSGGALNR
ncbi:tape measure protein [Glaesserella parasuis]|uniref:tape measure protein n=1 Tax=Glaesserella parasuis TaxID=738 RepID=UPI0006865E42|nr:tape measure protein [Glaesserella parasuis]MDP0329312.1 tape measure protein [Glaesserella parasuis]MDP0391780.1 tape measure protein [Glaesserella parasuis]